MSKALTLDEILSRFTWARDYPELMYEESKNDAKQAILQWVADEVVGTAPFNYPFGGIEDAARISTDVQQESLRTEQRQILKDHGWKQSTEGGQR